MKKLPLLLGALGGGLAGYLFSNQKLRDELANAKDSKHAAKILGKYLSADGEKIAKDVKEFAESDEVQNRIGSAKKYANDYYKKARKEIDGITKKATKSAKSTAKKTAKKAKSAVKKTAKKATKKAKSSAKTGRKRIATKVKKIS